MRTVHTHMHNGYNIIFFAFSGRVKGEPGWAHACVIPYFHTIKSFKKTHLKDLSPQILLCNVQISMPKLSSVCKIKIQKYELEYDSFFT